MASSSSSSWRLSSFAKSRNSDPLALQEDEIAKEAEDGEDGEWMKEVDQLDADHRLLDAARLLSKKINNKNSKKNWLNQDDHYRQRQRQRRHARYLEILREAHEFEQAIADLTGPPDASWTKQGESHGGKFDSTIYYKVEEDAKLYCRVETPIESSLLIPLLSVLNEVELYQTWVPSYTFPVRFGIESTQRLLQASRTDQTFQIQARMPFPFSPRDVMIRAHAIDDIETHGYIVIRFTSAPVGGVVSPPGKNVVRVDVDGAMLFRACPPDHPLLQQTLKRKRTRREPMVLASVKLQVQYPQSIQVPPILGWIRFNDAQMAGVSKSLINFITRTLIGDEWGMLLAIAESVRDGKRPQHDRVIARRADMYNFFRQKIQRMLDQLHDDHHQHDQPCSEEEEEEETKFISYLQG